jgi:spore maturation protein CgeB
MKIVIFGLTISSSWGNGHATLLRGLCRALIRGGHRIIFFERDRPYYAAHRDLTELPHNGLRLYREWADIESSARLELSDADVGIITSYCSDGVAATESLLDSGSDLKVFYDLDTPVTLDALQSRQTVDYLGPRGLADFDLVLSFTGGRALDELQVRLGAKRVAPLYGSVDPGQHHPVAREPRFASDLSYLGTFAPDRQPTLEALFFETARVAPDQRFLIGGAQYPDNIPWRPNIFFVHHLEPAQHAAFFSSSRLTLNVTRRAMKAMGYCPSGRLFEAAACETPIVTDNWMGLDHFFRAGSEIVLAQSSEDVHAALDLSEAELTAIGRRSRERVLQEHTAEHRATELERLLSSALSPLAAPKVAAQPVEA